MAEFYDKTKDYDRYRKLAASYLKKNPQFIVGKMSPEDFEFIVNIGASVMMTRDGFLPGGGFAQSIVQNDLAKAVGAADKTAIRALRYFVAVNRNLELNDPFNDTLDELKNIINKNIKRKLNESIESERYDGLEIQYIIDDIIFVSAMELGDKLMPNYWDAISADWSKMEELEKQRYQLINNWIAQHNALLWEYWDKGEGHGQATAEEIYEAAKKAKQENKKIVVLEYNS